jgi:GT2 family glycosyltransferase
MDKNSTISIVVPCRNEVQNIEKLLISIEETTYPKELIHVSVVDGMSDDGTRELLNTIMVTKKYSYSLNIIDNLKQKTPYAFNLGIKKSESDIVIILGSRHEISSNYLQEVVNVLESDEEIACVGGVVNNTFSNATSRVISAAMESPFGIGFNNFRSIKEDTFVDTIGSPAFRRLIFDEIGYFDERLTRNQDDDFSFRLIKAGYKILLKANISVKYLVRASLSKLFKQYKQYGYWKVFVNKKHSTITTARQLFPAIFVLSLFGGVLLSFLHPIFAFLFGMELTLYFLLSAIFAFKNKNLTFSQKILHIQTCFVLHFSYGLGYLQGILDFLILGRGPRSNQETLSR